MIGILVVLISTGCIGYIFGERAKRQIELLSSLRRCVSVVESEVRYMGTEMANIYEIIANGNEEWSAFFGKMSDNMREYYAINAEHVLSENITDYLSKEDKKELLRFLCEPCGHDRQKEVARINAYADRLDARIKFLEADVSGRIKLMRMLGVSSGIFLILLIV